MIEFLLQVAFLLFLVSLPVGSWPAGGLLRRTAFACGGTALLLFLLKILWFGGLHGFLPLAGCVAPLGLLSLLSYGVLAVRRRLLGGANAGRKPESWAYIGKDPIDVGRGPSRKGRR